MNNRIINFAVSNQFITADETCVVAGSKNYLFARFIFDPSWDGVIKTAVFSDGDDTAYNMVLTDDMCRVPAEIIAEPGFYVSVYGGDLITADSVRVAVEPSGLIEGVAPPTPTADVYNQLTTLVASEVSAASGYADDAQAYAEECESNTADAAAYAASALSYSQNAQQYASGSQNYATSAASSASDASDALSAALDAQESAEEAESTVQSCLLAVQMSQMEAQESATAAAASATAAEQAKTQLNASVVPQKKGTGVGSGAFNDTEYNTAAGAYSSAFGLMTNATGSNAIAFGTMTTASGTQSVAGGNNTTASGDNSVALGNQTAASHSRSVAFGYMTQTAKDGQVVIGKHNSADSTADFIIGNGTDPNNQNNEFTVKNNEAYINGEKVATESFVSGAVCGAKFEKICEYEIPSDAPTISITNTVAGQNLNDYSHFKFIWIGTAEWINGTAESCVVTLSLMDGAYLNQIYAMYNPGITFEGTTQKILVADIDIFELTGKRLFRVQAPSVPYSDSVARYTINGTDYAKISANPYNKLISSIVLKTSKTSKVNFKSGGKIALYGVRI